MNEEYETVVDYDVEEAFRTLRTRLLTGFPDVRSIVITSCMGMEGKSYIADKLAFHLSKVNKKVVVVDADLRKQKEGSGKHKCMLSDYLSGQGDMSELIEKTSKPGFYRISNTDICNEAQELLSNKRASKLLQELKQEMDYVIVDTPTIGAVSDALVLSKYCDGMIIVIEPNIVDLKMAQKTVEQLKQNGCNILGVIMNKR